MKCLIQNAKVALSPIHRFGVFAAKTINKGSTIEQCPYIITVREEQHPSQIQDYLFTGDAKNSTHILLGYGGVYNHSKKNNADYFDDIKNNVITFYALRKIKKGEEIFINYGRAYWKLRSRPR